MSDILDRAHILSEGHKLCQLPDDGRDALALLPELIAEIKQQAAYVARLEAAFLEAEEMHISLTAKSGTEIVYADRLAREALEKIRGEKE